MVSRVCCRYLQLLQGVGILILVCMDGSLGGFLVSGLGGLLLIGIILESLR